jgi:hypothetical protein
MRLVWDWSGTSLGSPQSAAVRERVPDQLDYKDTPPKSPRILVEEALYNNASAHEGWEICHLVLTQITQITRRRLAPWLSCSFPQARKRGSWLTRTVQQYYSNILTRAYSKAKIHNSHKQAS